MKNYLKIVFFLPIVLIAFVALAEEVKFEDARLTLDLPKVWMHKVIRNELKSGEITEGAYVPVDVVCEECLTEHHAILEIQLELLSVAFEEALKGGTDERT